MVITYRIVIVLSYNIYWATTITIIVAINSYSCKLQYLSATIIATILMIKWWGELKLLQYYSQFLELCLRGTPFIASKVSTADKTHIGFSYLKIEFFSGEKDTKMQYTVLARYSP